MVAEMVRRALRRPNRLARRLVLGSVIAEPALVVRGRRRGAGRSAAVAPPSPATGGRGGISGTEEAPARETEGQRAGGTERERAGGTERERAEGSERERAGGTERERAGGTEHEGTDQ
jgi:hypothetical protein